MRKSIIARSIIALALLGAVTSFASVSAEAAPRGPARFYDQNGGDRGYAWCLKAGLEIFDCSYFTLAQCNQSASTRRVYCVLNPFAVEQGYNPDAPTQTRRKVRQQT